MGQGAEALALWDKSEEVCLFSSEKQLMAASQCLQGDH